MTQFSGSTLLEPQPKHQPMIVSETPEGVSLPLVDEHSFNEGDGQFIEELLPPEVLRPVAARRPPQAEQVPDPTIWESEGTLAWDLIQGNAQEDRALKLATAISVWLAVGLLWMPHFNLQPHADLVRMVNDPPKRRKVLRPPVQRPVTETKLRQRQTQRLPLPDSTPLVMEPLVHFDPIVELTLVAGSDWEIGIPDNAPSPEAQVVRAGAIGVEPPIITKRLAATYPEKAKAVKVEGYVILEALLKRDGSIDNLKILRSLAGGHWGFEEAAKAAVRAWEFTPGKYKDKPSDVLMTLKIDFRLVD